MLAVACGRVWAQPAPPAKPGPEEAAKPQPQEQLLTVTIKEVTGTAQRLVPGEKPSWVPLKAGDKLGEQTVIRTGLRSRVVLAFADSSELTIARATKMGIAEFRKEGPVTKTRLGLKYGSLRASVEKARGPNDFTVSTPVATLAVTGSGGQIGHCGDIGSNVQCSFGGFSFASGSRSLNLTGGQSTNSRLLMPILLTQLQSVPQLGDVFNGLTPSETTSLLNFGGGLGGVGFLPGAPVAIRPPLLPIGGLICPNGKDGQYDGLPLPPPE
ncbi:MAG: hypothetical protein AMJ81_12940 [Phycisphaerae bacterium SM23_33]|nr:MAG: hypothetical protein AMJ81_12940 [Phycisphaerae bacterium SM23_33]